MGKRGPAPTPKEILNARGSWRGKAKSTDPVFDMSPPECADWVDDQAKAYHAALVRMLANANVLRLPDGFALERYCVLLSRWRKCEEFIAKNGHTYAVKDEHGKVVGTRPFPEVRIATDLASQLRRLEAEFGLTPSARSRIIAGEPPAPPAKPKPAGPPIMRIAQ